MELTAQIELGGRPPSAAEVALATELLEEKKRAEELEVMLKAERTRAAEMEKRLKEREKLLEHGLGQEKVERMAPEVRRRERRPLFRGSQGRP